MPRRARDGGGAEQRGGRSAAVAVANRCRRLPSAADGLRRRLMNRRVTAAANPTEASPSNKLCSHYYHTPPRPRQTPEPTAGSEPGLALDLVVFWRFTPEQVADEIIPAPAYMTCMEPSGQSPSAAMEQRGLCRLRTGASCRLTHPRSHLSRANGKDSSQARNPGGLNMSS